ncbi:MAG: PKD domain-containing protein, partial [Candidatus Woesearchaeota archaeon]
MKKTILPIIFLIIISGEVLGALASATWTLNNDIQLTINNGENAEFEYRILAVSNYQGVIGTYSIWFYKQGSNIPLRTYFYNQPTINNGAEGYITIYPSDYLQAGNYYVRVYANDFFGSDNHIITLKVQNITTLITGTCEAEPTTGNIPLTTELTATINGGTGTYKYQWTFGDGTTKNTTTNNIFHTYNKTGTYKPQVKITDNKGNTATINCTTITATQTTPITGTCEAEPTTGNIPLTTELTATINGGTGTYKYQWTFGDGTT